ncbi:MAG TPA: urease accessory UreF family protein [Stellaceae bacterium]|nr:urease accessory UreF family protein [Stellaceae bacterium]
MITEPGGLYRLLAWASPAFPIGAFSYSHGLEAAAAEGSVHDRATLESWIKAVIVRGSGRVDSDILRDAWRAVKVSDDAVLAVTNGRGCAYRATAELATESGQQGMAFTAAYEAAWTGHHLNPPPLAKESFSGDICHAAAFGAASARAGVSLGDALTAYLAACAANLMSAGLRLGIIGQNDGQRILAALELDVSAAVAASLAREMQDFGSATFAADLASMAHETQYTRLFRS